MNEQELLSRLEEVNKALQEVSDRLSGLERWQLMRMQEDLSRILTNLFSEQSGTKVKALRDALRQYNGSADSAKPAVAVLTELNRVNGQPRNPGLNGLQLRGLKALLTEEQFAPISPIGQLSDPRRKDQISQQAMAFWRELLSKEPSRVHDFHVAVTDYVADASRLQHVLSLLQQMVPAFSWNQEHVNALARINTRDAEFRNLAWFPYDGDFW
jgi:hypothetical protein